MCIAWKRGQIAKGLCTRCKSKATHGRMCLVHAMMNRHEKRLHDRRRRAAGLCQRCTRRAVRGRVFCAHHLAKARAYMRSYMPSWESKRRALGLCVNCPKRSEDGGRQCRACRWKYNARRAAKAT